VSNVFLELEPIFRAYVFRIQNAESMLHSRESGVQSACFRTGQPNRLPHGRGSVESLRALRGRLPRRSHAKAGRVK
jgi:hypothetical protein